MRQLRCLKRKGIKGLRGKSPDTPNKTKAALIDEDDDTRREVHDPRAAEVALRRTPVERGQKPAKVAGNCMIGTQCAMNYRKLSACGKIPVCTDVSATLGCAVIDIT